jgi:hypothetical protein
MEVGDKVTLDINPVEQLLKAVGIIDGPVVERRWRYIVGQIDNAQQQASPREEPKTEIPGVLNHSEHGCEYSRAGRGDCEHYVGLPGRSIPGQHDGTDDTVDVYGRPNGWCWRCWLSFRNEQLRQEKTNFTVKGRPEQKLPLTRENLTMHYLIAILRNPYGWSEEEQRVCRHFAADLAEGLEKLMPKMRL